MNFLIYGAGAIGGYVGGLLALEAESVTFVARPRQAAILNERGLTIDNVPPRAGRPAGTRQIASNVRAVASPAEAYARGRYDCLVLALKAFDTDTAIAELQAAGVPPPVILCLQNGVDNEPKLAAAFGPGGVIAGTILTAVGVPETGAVTIEKDRGAGIAGGHPLSQQLAASFNAAGIRTRLYPDPPAMKWTKLLTNLMGNATAAICDVSTVEVFSHPGLYALEVGALKEALAVMRAQGLRAVALPRSPTLPLVLALQYLPPRLYQSIFRRALASGRGNKKPSLLMDLAAGKPRSEVGFLNGAVARHAAIAGLAAPINRGLTEILEAILAGRIPWADYRGRPEKLAAMLK